MSYKDINLRSVYNSSIGSLMDDFYLPVLSETIRYDRATGFFSSNIINYLGHSFHSLIKSGGRIRLVTGVELSENDVEQISTGYELREIVSENLMNVVEQLTIDPTNEGLTLCWLIKNDLLDLKVSISQTEDNGVKRGIYHEKFGVMEDREGNKIVFAGSINESQNGWMYNYESFDVFRNWETAEQERVRIREENFDALWENRTPGVQVLDFPTAVRARIVEIAPHEPPLINKVSSISKIKDSVELRPYQNEAIQSWIDAGYRGIFEMATGSGKTLTSLFAAKRLLNTNKNSIVVILCPYSHLVDQWEKEAHKVGFNPLKCYQSSSTWKKNLSKLIADYKSGRIETFSIISTMDTASSDTFLSLIDTVQDRTMILADEMHNLGSTKRRYGLLPNAPYRLGLSATPSRWMDEEGTQTLYDYFGETVYSFSLSKAIEYGFLTPYYYYPIPVEFTEDEWSEYEEISAKMSKLMFSEDSRVKESLERLAIKRANICNNATGKIKALSELLLKKGRVSHSLVYTSPKLLPEVRSLVSSYGIYAAKFTAEETMSERNTIISMFSTGQLDLLVAMKCLDEGVDVPSIREAYILASSSNPKEFIQRRGRVLRKAPGKQHSVIYDFLVIPPSGAAISNVARNLIKKELSRFREFSETARNYYQARVDLSNIARKYNVLGDV